MNVKKLLTYIFFLPTIFYTAKISAQDKQDIIVAVNKPIAEVQPTIWGIFFEDINFGTDGGIYATGKIFCNRFMLLFCISG